LDLEDIDLESLALVGVFLASAWLAMEENECAFGLVRASEEMERNESAEELINGRN
jgi:hypothetical protein